MKALGGRYLSLTLFAFVQVTMDLEVILRLILGISHLHGFSNTIIGATVVLLLSVPIGKPVCEWVLRWWNRNLSAAQARWLWVSESISWKAAWIGGIAGVYSHLVLDAMMHTDARPWLPFSEVNPFVGLVSMKHLDLLCALTLLIGAALTGVYGLRRGGRPGREGG